MLKNKEKRFIFRKLLYLCRVINHKQIKINQMTPKQIIKAEYKRRTDLVNDLNFRKQCVKMAKALGITADEWNKDKVHIMLIFANKVCQLQNHRAV